MNSIEHNESLLAQKIVLEKLKTDWKKKKDDLLQQLLLSTNESKSCKIKNKIEELDIWYEKHIEEVNEDIKNEESKLVLENNVLIDSNYGAESGFCGFSFESANDNDISKFIDNLNSFTDQYNKIIKNKSKKCRDMQIKKWNIDHECKKEAEHKDTELMGSKNNEKTKYTKKDYTVSINILDSIYTVLTSDSIIVEGLSVPLYLYNTLFDYQKQSISWFYNLYKKKQGGILADEMGLGKTLQVISFLASMFISKKINYVIILSPSTVLKQWYTEFKTYFPFIRVVILHKTHTNNIKKIINECRNMPSVILLSYDGFKNYHSSLLNIKFDYIVLDEGHKIKNKDTIISKIIKNFEGDNRIVISGTPIQNNLRELWALFDFIAPGLLGSHSDFIIEYEDPIKKGSYGASQKATEKAYRTSVILRNIIEPNIIRRLKKQVSYVKTDYLEINKDKKTSIGSDNSNNDRIKRRKINTMKNINHDHNNIVSSNKATTNCTEEVKKIDNSMVYKLPDVSDKILFVELTKEQENIYEKFLRSDYIYKILIGKVNCMGGLMILRKICNHPYLYEKNEKYLELQSRKNYNSPIHKKNQAYTIDSESINTIKNDTVENSCSLKINLDYEFDQNNSFVKFSGKMKKLAYFLKIWKTENKKVLVFSQMIGMIELIEKYLKLMNYTYLRMDGKTTLSTRSSHINLFNDENKNIFIFLLTTRVGGLGLNLIGASRIVIYDPDWNPSTDTQAKERAWRFGQKNNVEIYRFITKGTIEEKIYKRQVFKGYLTNKILKNPTHTRIFEKDDINDLFTYEKCGAKSNKEIEENNFVDYENIDNARNEEDGLNFFKGKKVCGELENKMSVFRGKEILNDEEMIEFIRIREEFDV